MATGKTSRYRYNVRPETILSQAPKRLDQIPPKNLFQGGLRGFAPHGEGAETKW